MKNIFFLFFLAYSFCVYGQYDTIFRFKEVVVKGYKLKTYSKGYKIASISDTLLAVNNTSLTDVLRYNTPVFFKEYGSGMLSSASFRGTSASQTAVIWNGININSPLNGQTDFNTISINNVAEIDVRSGGGSVLFGSGAIGGSVHLNNAINFEKKAENKLSFSAGSFTSYLLDVSTTHATTTSFLNFGMNYNESKNDYEFLNTNLKNDNASYYQLSFSGNFGLKLNSKNWLKLYSNTALNDRNNARSLNAPSKSKLKNNSFRNLLELNSFLSIDKVITSKIACLVENYQYFENRFNTDVYANNSAKTFIASVDYQQEFSEKISINTLLKYESSYAKGRDITNNSRHVLAMVAVLNHNISKGVSYSAQLRKEFSNAYDVPLLYSLGIQIRPTTFYTIRANTSKNFRAPTLNDLFWKGAGNINLQPENSCQFEIGNHLDFKNVSFTVSGFFIKTNNLIQWLPNLDSGVWQPNNVAKTNNYGLETQLSFRKNRQHQSISVQGNYALTFAKNLAKNRDLIYVPKHNINVLATYQFKNISAFYQQLINGKVLVFADDFLPRYSVSNVGVNYQINQKINISAKINNMFNSAYQNYQYYPMPPRNYQLQIQLNI